ncbi:MAG: NAD(P)H-dependent flavin oxidoreductase [Alphaproteobacteria bacterium]
MKSLNAIRLGGKEVLPLIEGGKGISISNGASAGAWAAAGGIGTVSCVNADSYDADGNVIPQVYHGRTRTDRHEELIKYAVDGGLAQIREAYERASGNGWININVLWEMGGAQRVLHEVLDKARDMIHGVTCGAGMPYKLSEIAQRYNVDYYPIISSGRAFRALWKRAYHKCEELLGGVVYEDPWKAGGHNGLSNSEDPLQPEPAYPRVAALRKQMNEFGLHDTPIIMAGGVWYLRDYEDWLDNPEIGPICFQFGTRPLVTKESPIPEKWKRRLMTLDEGDVQLHKHSPTGFYSSAVRNDFLRELDARTDRQIAYTAEPVGEHNVEFSLGLRKRTVFVTRGDRARVEAWKAEGFVETMPTPDQTLIFVTPEKRKEIHKDQADCMGCLSACKFSNWSDTDNHSTGKKADPRSFCIQKTLMDIAHGGDLDENLMFAGHGAYNFAKDPFYSNGFVPSVKQLVDRIATGD